MKRVLVLALTLLALGASEAQAVPCERSCAKELTAKQRVQRWRTPQGFKDALISVSVVNENGGLLRSHRTKNGCKATYYGRGLIVKVRACGDEPAHLRFSYRAKEPERFTLYYEAGPL